MHDPTVIDTLAAAARDAPDRCAVSADGSALCYADYAARVATFAAGLLARGVTGQRVAVALPDGLDACVAFYAVLAAQAQLVPLDPYAAPARLGRILQDATPKLLLHADGAAALTALVNARGIATLPLTALTTNADHAPPALASPDPDSLAVLQYDCSRGPPRGVNLSHRAIAAGVARHAAALPPGCDGAALRALCVTPLYDAYTQTLGLHLCALARGTLLLAGTRDPPALLTALSTGRVSLLPADAALLRGLIEHPGFASADYAALRVCYCNGVGLPAALLAYWERTTGAPLCEGYGSAEAGPLLCCNPVDGIRKPGSAGIAPSAGGVEIVDVATGTRVLKRNEIGTIRVRGPQIMDGYRNQPAATAAALRQGWLYTGDLGRLDEDGYLYPQTEPPP